MDFSDDIKFSNDLIKNGEVYIVYSGNLYKQNSESVHIVYGFGNNWEHTLEKEMEKNSKGFAAKIKLLDYDKFNFCFKNQYNEWDNNNCSNYSAQIIDNNNYEENFIINEDLLGNLIDNIFSNNNIDTKNTFKNEEIVSENQTTEITNDNTNIDVQNIENIVNESTDNEVIIDIENNNSESTTEIDTETSIETQENETSDNTNFNMDALIDEILSPIVTSENFVEENLEDYKKTTNTDVLEIFEDNTNNEYNENDKHVDDVITNYLNDLYYNINNTINSSSSIITNNTQTTTDNSTNSEYSELDKTISKFKQIQALQDLDSFFETSSNDATSTENESLSQEKTTVEIEDNQIQSNTFEENEEQSLIEEVIQNTSSDNEQTNNETALIVSPRNLSPLYIVKKKIKISFLKIFKFIPRLLNKKLNEN